MSKREKKVALEALLSAGDAMICVDSRGLEVVVPPQHAGKKDLRLVLNLGFRRPVAVVEDGVDAELVFGGAPHRCWIPFENLWAAFDPQTGRGFVWADSAPEGVLKDSPPAGTAPAADSPSAEGDAGSPRPSGSKQRPALRVIPGGKKDPG